MGKGVITNKEEHRVEFTLLLYDFGIDNPKMEPDHGKWLDDIIALAKANPQTEIRLRGSASKSGDAQHNRDPLSRGRAEAVAMYLVVEKKVNSKQVVITWTGADKSTSTLKEDERDRAVEVNVKAPVTIEEVTFWNDSWTKQLEWDDIIGLDENKPSSPGKMGIPINNVNLQVVASGAPRSLMPKSFRAKLRSTVPGKENWGKTTLTRPFELDIPLSSVIPKDSTRHWYRQSTPISQVGPFQSWQLGKILEVALVVREEGTSDLKFRIELGNVADRGRAEQTDKPSTGSEMSQVPDAKRLFMAGGVEVLSAFAVEDTGLILKNKPISRLVRSPADIFYYSGHGLGKEGCLAIHGNYHSASVDGYACWLNPSDLRAYWKNPFDLSVLIIAGCSVLNLDKSGGEWANLLKTKGGPLDVILGYEAAAPLDSNGGDDIASAMGKRVTANLTEYQWVRAWLDVNGSFRAWNAVGFNSLGRWWLDPSTASKIWHKLPGTSDSVSFDIKGPEPIP
jgi:hypothetical protein